MRDREGKATVKASHSSGVDGPVGRDSSQTLLRSMHTVPGSTEASRNGGGRVLEKRRRFLNRRVRKDSPGRWWEWSEVGRLTAPFQNQPTAGTILINRAIAEVC